MDGPIGQDPSSQTGCGRYTRQNAQASMIAATPIMYGRYGAQRAIVTAPGTPKRTTAQGPMQQKPINDANVLMPIAPPVVATVVRCRPVGMSSFTVASRFDDLHLSDSKSGRYMAETGQTLFSCANVDNSKPGTIEPGQVLFLNTAGKTACESTYG